MRQNDKFTFFKESIGNFRDTGSFVPSSIFLARRLSAPIDLRPNLKIVELGAGIGSVTKFLLKTLPIDARLISIEINPVLARRLAVSIRDPRCEIVKDDAVKLREILALRNIEKVDYVISGIPLGNLPAPTRLAIYDEIKKCLRDGGIYMQFQYLMANFVEIKRHFKVCKVAFEWRNIPPAFVYTLKLL